MENSPLELYETAYRLQYAENNVPEALTYYEALIKDFPESNECGYAVVQINKIKSNAAAASISGARGKGGALAAVSFILCLLIAAGLWVIWDTSQEKIAIAQKQASLSARALGNLLNGNDDDALALLDEMKLISQTDITPYELSAQIYRKAGKIEKARAEYDVFFSLNPGEKERSKPINEIVPDAVEKKPPQKLK